MRRYRKLRFNNGSLLDVSVSFSHSPALFNCFTNRVQVHEVTISMAKDGGTESKKKMKICCHNNLIICIHGQKELKQAKNKEKYCVHQYNWVYLALLLISLLCCPKSCTSFHTATHSNTYYSISGWTLNRNMRYSQSAHLCRASWKATKNEKPPGKSISTYSLWKKICEFAPFLSEQKNVFYLNR